MRSSRGRGAPNRDAMDASAGAPTPRALRRARRRRSRARRAGASSTAFRVTSWCSRTAPRRAREWRRPRPKNGCRPEGRPGSVSPAPPSARRRGAVAWGALVPTGRRRARPRRARRGPRTSSAERGMRVHLRSRSRDPEHPASGVSVTRRPDARRTSAVEAAGRRVGRRSIRTPRGLLRSRAIMAARAMK